MLASVITFAPTQLTGLTGERNVYKRRGLPEEKGLNMTKPKHLTLLVDVSGSMYRSVFLCNYDVYFNNYLSL